MSKSAMEKCWTFVTFFSRISYLTFKFLSSQFFLFFYNTLLKLLCLAIFWWCVVFFFSFCYILSKYIFQHTLVSFLFSFFFIIFLSFFCCHFLCYLFFCVHVLIVLFIWFVISNLAFLQFVRRCRSWLPIFILIFLTIMCVFFHFILSIVLSLFFTFNVV